MALALQLALSGLAAGALYGLIGIGFSLIYRLGLVLDFAHGDLMTFSIFAFLFALAGGAPVALTGQSEVGLALAGLAALAVTAAAAMLVQRVAVAPFQARRLAPAWIAGTAAAGLLLRAAVVAVFPGESYTVPDPLGLSGAVRLGPANLLQVRWPVMLAVALLLSLAVDRWLVLSRPGRAMRATSMDAEAAALCGVAPARMRLWAWALAGLLVAAAGLLLAPARPVTVTLGATLGLKGVAAAVLGGLDRTGSALVAGMAIGLLEAVVGATGAGASFFDVVAAALLVAVLAVLPNRAGVAPESSE